MIGLLAFLGTMEIDLSLSDVGSVRMLLALGVHFWAYLWLAVLLSCEKEVLDLLIWWVLRF